MIRLASLAAITIATVALLATSVNAEILAMINYESKTKKSLKALKLSGP